MSNGNVTIPEIYTNAGEEQLVINGLNSIESNKELPLGFSTGTSNEFAIEATEASNFDTNTRIILKDNFTDTEQDITDGTAYTFSSDVVNTSSRFSIIFRTASITTTIEDKRVGNQTMYIYKKTNNLINIVRNGAIDKEGMVMVCNSFGQKLVSLPTTGSCTVINKSFIPGVYLVTLYIGGNAITKKLIIN